MIISRTPDRIFRCLYPCEIILSKYNSISLVHVPVPVPAPGKDKKKRTTARRPQASRTSFRDVIVMLKCRYHVESQQFQDFLEAFFMAFPYKMWYLVVSKKNNPLFVWGWDRKIRPSRSQIVITRQSSWCQSVILRTDFPIPFSHSWHILIFCRRFKDNTNEGGYQIDPTLLRFHSFNVGNHAFLYFTLKMHPTIHFTLKCSLLGVIENVCKSWWKEQQHSSHSRLIFSLHETMSYKYICTH